jgi:hypothetical protein
VTLGSSTASSNLSTLTISTVGSGTIGCSIQITLGVAGANGVIHGTALVPPNSSAVDITLTPCPDPGSIILGSSVVVLILMLRRKRLSREWMHRT